jgi:hypothetical protein
VFRRGRLCAKVVCKSCISQRLIPAVRSNYVFPGFFNQISQRRRFTSKMAGQSPLRFALCTLEEFTVVEVMMCTA